MNNYLVRMLFRHCDIEFHDYVQIMATDLDHAHDCAEEFLKDYWGKGRLVGGELWFENDVVMKEWHVEEIDIATADRLDGLGLAFKMGRVEL